MSPRWVCHQLGLSTGELMGRVEPSGETRGVKESQGPEGPWTETILLEPADEGDVLGDAACKEVENTAWQESPDPTTVLSVGKDRGDGPKLSCWAADAERGLDRAGQ